MDDLISSEDNYSTREEEWIDSDKESLQNVAKCVFCKHHDSPAVLVEHLISEHDFNIQKTIDLLKLNEIEYIKLINYLRSTGTKPVVLEHDLFAADDFMRPVIENDPLLYDVDFIFGKEEFDQTLHLTNENIQLKKEVAELRKFIKNELLESHGNMKIDKPENATRKNIDTDSYYFESYSGFDIHEIMLKDRVRTEAYINFINSYSNLFEDKIVLDIGCGTGILSMECSKFAQKVIGVDRSNIIKYAEAIIKDNRLKHKIDLYHTKVEDLILNDKPHVIISEWMGYFLLYESMMDSVIYARDHLLRRGTDSKVCVYPQISNLYVAGFHNDQILKEHYEYWDNVYGYNMKCIKNKIYSNALIKTIAKEYILTQDSLVKTFDLNVIETKDTEFKRNIELVVTKDGVLNGLVGYFDIIFDNNYTKSNNYFTTSYQNKETHWKQTIFIFKDPIKVAKNDKIKTTIILFKSMHNRREITVQIDIKQINNTAINKSQQYNIA